MEPKYGFSVAKYAGNGVTAQFAVPFPYLAQSDVIVSVFDANDVIQGSYVYSWINASTVAISPAPVNDHYVFIERRSGSSNERVDFADGGTITERDLDTAYRHALYVAQEAMDAAGILQLSVIDLTSQETAAAISAANALVSANNAANSQNDAADSAAAAAASASAASLDAAAAAASAAAAAASISAVANLKLDKAANLSDVADVPTARDNLGLDSMALEAAADYLPKAGNLSGLADTAIARTNLGLGNVDNTSDILKPISTAVQSALNNKLNAASNLSDIGSIATTRVNLGLSRIAEAAVTVSILDYGGDNTGATDSATALTNALASHPNVQVRLGRGTYRIDSTVALPVGTSIVGEGIGLTTVKFKGTNSHLFDVLLDNCAIADMTIQYDGATAGLSGAIAIYTHGVSGDTAANGIIARVRIKGGGTGCFYNGIYLNGGAGVFNLTDIQVQNTEHDGIVAKSIQGYWLNVNVLACKGNGLTLSFVAGGGVNPWITGFQSFANGGWDVWTDAGITMVNFFLNNSSLGNLYIGTTASADNGYVAHGNLQYAGDNPFNSAPYPVITTSPAIKVDTGGGPVSFTDIHIFNPQGNCFENNTSGTVIVGGRFLGAGTGGTASKFAILSSTTGSEFTVHGVTVNKPCKFSGARSSIIGNKFGCNDASVAVWFAAGTDQIFNANDVNNAGAGGAFQADVGVTLVYGTNTFRTGSVVNNATLTGTQWRAPIVQADVGGLTTASSPTFTALTLTNGQIAFPATQVPSANANTLDDYEEGTFTAGISFGGASVGITYSIQSATYTKVGRHVWGGGRVLLTNKGSSTGGAQVTGLPFTVPNATSSLYAAVVRLAVVTFTGQFQSSVDINATTMSLYQVTTAGAFSAITNANFANTSDVIFSFHYPL